MKPSNENIRHQTLKMQTDTLRSQTLLHDMTQNPSRKSKRMYIFQPFFHPSMLLHPLWEVRRSVCTMTLLQCFISWYLMSPPHRTLASNQRLPYNPGKAPSFIVDTSSYPNAPIRTCSGDFKVGSG